MHFIEHCQAHSSHTRIQLTMLLEFYKVHKLYIMITWTHKLCFQFSIVKCKQTDFENSCFLLHMQIIACPAGGAYNDFVLVLHWSLLVNTSGQVAFQSLSIRLKFQTGTRNSFMWENYPASLRKVGGSTLLK
jgi:hypothetical protein